MNRRNKVVSVQETRAQVTREKLLNAAIDLVSRNGMEALTVRNICDEAGLSTGSFYNLFSGKDELITYYLKHSFESYKLTAEEEAADYNVVEKCLLVYRFYVRCCKDAGLEFVSGLYSATNSPFFDFKHRDSEDEIVIDLVGSYLERGKEEGVIREDVDVEEAKLRIAAIVTGLQFYWCVFKGGIDVAYQTDSLLRTYLCTLVNKDVNLQFSLAPLEDRGAFLGE
ncbi:MAG: TetR/AcrR family transcriptional regulator [Coriobacteriia bacterium]|nr:TetR/AcrR family transcriptional regulator [Coriobacteriia bacterium]